METLAERLKYLRLKKGFKSKSIAAQAIGIPYGTYQGYEYGLLPGEKNYKKIANFYKCSLLWVKKGVGEPFPNDYEYKKQPAINEKMAAYAPNIDSLQSSHASEIRISDAIIMCTRVLESGTSYATALYLNIQHFDRAVNSELFGKKCQEDLELVNDSIKKMQNRMDEMEKDNGKLQEEIRKLKGSSGGSAPINLSPDNAALTGTEDQGT